MTKFEEEFNYLIELSGKVLIGQVDAEAFEKNRIAFFEKYETDQQQALPKTVEDFQGELEDLIDDILDDYISDLPFDGKKYKFIEKYAPQALPVVPECVDIWIKKCQELNWMITDVLAPESWSSDFAKDTENWLKKSKENFNLLALAFITGKYEVEKPQLFYLKNKMTGDFLAICLARASSGLYVEVTEKWLTRKEQTSYKLYFTQQEIDSMQTGSYEQIEVAE